MAVLTLNGIGVSSAEIALPITGRSYADVRLGEIRPVGVGTVCTLEFETGDTIRMTVQRAGLEGGFPNLVLVGGANKLNQTLEAKHYQGAPLSLILSDIVQDAGETLGTVDAPMVMRHWLRARSNAMECLVNAAARADGRNWRIARDGKLSVAIETWAAHTRTLEVIEAHPETAHWVLEPDWGLEPGRVVNVFDAGERSAFAPNASNTLSVRNVSRRTSGGQCEHSIQECRARPGRRAKRGLHRVLPRHGVEEQTQQPRRRAS
ncbi:MAG: hypothetical protein HC933_00840 [Pleurocapsa sp. SU_196_0]|nr:hypothetical protein [Pleurocapsa sp. SU_196_0]